MHRFDLRRRFARAAEVASHPIGHVGWAIRQLREPDGGYLLAPVQEALHECYAGIRLASALDGARPPLVSFSPGTRMLVTNLRARGR